MSKGKTYKKFIVGIFYDPHNPKFRSFQILTLSKPPQIDNLTDWKGETVKIVKIDDGKVDIIRTKLTGWDDIVGPELRGKDNVLNTHLVRHSNRFPKFLFINDFRTWEEAQRIRDDVLYWWDNGGWKVGTSKLRATLLERYPGSRIVKVVKDLDEGTVYPSTAKASEVTGISQSSISKVARGIRNTAGGKKWAYFDIETGRELPKETKSPKGPGGIQYVKVIHADYKDLSYREKLDLINEIFVLEPEEKEVDTWIGNVNERGEVVSWSVETEKKKIPAWIMAKTPEGKIRPFPAEKFELMLEFIQLANEGEFAYQIDTRRDRHNSPYLSEEIVDLQIKIMEEDYFEAFLKYCWITTKLLVLPAPRPTEKEFEKDAGSWIILSPEEL